MHVPAIRDIVRVQADRRGHFEVKLLPGCTYAGWAWSRTDDGLSVFRGVVRRPGRRLEWGEVRGPRPSIRLRVEGLKAWQGPVKFVARSGAWRAELVLEGQFLRLPPVAMGLGLTILAKGIPIAARTITTDYDMWTRAQLRRRPESFQGSPSGGFARAFVERELDVGAPVRRRLRVVDAGGQAIAGAKLYVPNSRGHRYATTARHLVGATDEHGVVEVALSLREIRGRHTCDFHSLELLAPGFIAKTIPTSGIVGSEVSGQPIQVRLDEQRSFSIEGRLFLRDSKPARGLPLLLYANTIRGSGSSGSSRPQVVTYSDDAGRFRIAHRDPRSGFGLCAVLSPEHKGPLASSNGYPVCDVALLCVNRSPRDSKVDLGDLRIDKLRTIDLQILDSEQQPARFSQVLIGMGRTVGARQIHYPHRLEANHVGRIRLIVPWKDPVTIAAASPNAGYGAFRCDELPVAAGPVRHVIRFEPLVDVTGRVVDERGNAMAGVMINLGVDSHVVSDLTRLYRFAHWPLQMKSDAGGCFRFRAAPKRKYVLHALFEHAKHDWRFRTLRRIDVRTEPVSGLTVELDGNSVWRRD